MPENDRQKAGSIDGWNPCRKTDRPSEGRKHRRVESMPEDRRKKKRLYSLFCILFSTRNSSSCVSPCSVQSLRPLTVSYTSPYIVQSGYCLDNDHVFYSSFFLLISASVRKCKRVCSSCSTCIHIPQYRQFPRTLRTCYRTRLQVAHRLLACCIL